MPFFGGSLSIVLAMSARGDARDNFSAGMRITSEQSISTRGLKF